MCEVLIPNLLANFVKENPEGLRIIGMSGKYAKMIEEIAKNIPSDQGLADLTISCLCLELEERPSIKERCTSAIALEITD